MYHWCIQTNLLPVYILYLLVGTSIRYVIILRIRECIYRDVSFHMFLKHTYSMYKLKTTNTRIQVYYTFWCDQIHTYLS